MGGMGDIFKDLRSEQARHQLECLGAYRLLRHFKGDWKAAEKHALKSAGKKWKIRGEQAWKDAVKVVDEAMFSSRAEITRQRIEAARKTKEWQKHFPGGRGEGAPWLSLTAAQKAYLKNILNPKC